MRPDTACRKNCKESGKKRKNIVCVQPMRTSSTQNQKHRLNVTMWTHANTKRLIELINEGFVTLQHIVLVIQKTNVKFEQIALNIPKVILFSWSHAA